MPGKEEQRGTRRKRADYYSPNSDGSRTSPEAKRLYENQACMADLHKDMCKESEVSAEHVQDPALAAIWETLVIIEANTNCLINEQKSLQRSYEELRESCSVYFISFVYVHFFVLTCVFLFSYICKFWLVFRL